MKNLKLTLIAGVLAGVSGVVQAGAVTINEDLSRRGPLSESGSGDTVEANCAIDPSGYDWQGATATIMARQVGGSSTVDVEVHNAVADTLFTVWLRIKGGAGFNDAGSPLTGGGATPLAPGSALDDLNAISPWVDAAGSSYSANSFTTNENGNGHFSVDLDFPLVGGAYPFQATATSRPGHEGHANVPTAIVDPRTGNGGPFMIRVISHCTDNASHGLSPATREAWFQYP